MRKHQHFNIRLHEDAEMAEIAKDVPILRETLHEWPMSHVERVGFAGGKTLIYKAQIGSGIEAAFYRAARSPHIPRCVAALESGEESWLLLEDVAGRPLEKLPEEEAWAMCRSLRRVVDGIDADVALPHDVSAVGVSVYIDETAAVLKKLRQGGQLAGLDVAAPDAFREAMGCPSARMAAQEAALLQGDFKPDNIIIRPDGTPVIIDWARALRGPAAVDMADFMALSGHDPVPRAGLGAEIMRLGREVRWFADCKDKWFKEAQGFDRLIGELVRLMTHLARTGGYGGERVYTFG